MKIKLTFKKFFQLHTHTTRRPIALSSIGTPTKIGHPGEEWAKERDLGMNGLGNLFYIKYTYACPKKKKKNRP